MCPAGSHAHGLPLQKESRATPQRDSRQLDATADNEMVIEVEPDAFEDMVVAALDSLPEDLGRLMRNVAVTEGNKVSAEIKLCYSVNGYGVGDLAHSVQQVSDAEVEKITREYDESYCVAESLREGGSHSIWINPKRMLMRKRL